LLDISITSRILDLNITKDGSDRTNNLTNASFQYIIKEYYIIIWAFLFKHDYAFRVFTKKQTN